MAAKFSHLGYKLKLHRTLMRFSIREAAEMIDISPSRLSQWERGIRKPGIESLVKLAVLYKVMIDDIVLDLRRNTTRKFDKKFAEVENDCNNTSKPKPT